MTATNQEVRNQDGTFGKGHKPSTSFADRPEDRSNGRWKKEDSISYNYNLFLSMSEEDFAEYTPVTKAQRIAYNRVKASEESLNDVKEITDRTEGKAPQTLDISNPDGSLNPYSQLSIEELRKFAGK